MTLDEKLIEEFTEENFKKEFYAYKIDKTDRYSNKVLKASGSLRTPQVPPGTNEHKFDI